MSQNPIARTRLWGNTALVVVVVVTIVGSFLTETHWEIFPWFIGTTALAYGVLSFVAHFRYPEKVEAAWDEQNTAAQRASLAFGYWAALAVFMLLLGTVLMEKIDAGVAFFWLGPVLGIGPSIHYLISVVRGRAE